MTPHRFGDDFVVSNSGLHTRYELDFWPNSINDWFSKLQSRFYLTETLRLIVWGFNSNYRLITIFFCLIWIFSLVLLVYVVPSYINSFSKLVFILLFGAAPYRNEFMLLPQGDGYILVLLMLIVSLLLVKHSFIRKNIPRNLIRIMSLLFFYFSLYLYEIGTVFSIAIMLGIFLTRRILKVKFRTDILWACLFPLVAFLHLTIIMLSPNQIWNRSRIHQLTPLDVFQYLELFTKNYLKAIIRPFGSLFWNEHEILRFLKVLFQNGFFSILVVAFVFNLILILRKRHFSPQSTKTYYQDFRDCGTRLDLFSRILIVGIIIVILSSPYIGFLTFAGGFPSRLLLLPTLGLSLIFIIPTIQIKKSKLILNHIFGYALVILILYFTLFSAFLIQSLNSVSKYDAILTKEIVDSIELNQKSFKFPILVNFPVPACQEVGFWRWNPSIWESNQGNLTLAESLEQLNGQENELSQIFYVPRSKPLHGNSISADGRSISSCSITQNSPSYFGYHAQEETYDYSSGIDTQFAFDKNLNMYRLYP